MKLSTRSIYRELLLLVLVCQCYLPAIVIANCKSVGSTDSAPAASPLPGLILNLDDRVTCDGQVKSWRYCYYKMQDADISTMYEATWGFYTIEPDKTDEYKYRAVNGSTIRVQLNGTEVRGSGYNCFNVTLNATQQFKVKVGDVVGACFPERSALNIIGQTNTSSESIVKKSECPPKSGMDRLRMTQHKLFLSAEIVSTSSNSVAVGFGVFIVFSVVIAVAVAAVIFMYWYNSKKKHIQRWANKVKTTKLLTNRSHQNNATLKCSERRPVTYRPASDKQKNEMKKKAQKTEVNMHSPILHNIYESPQTVHQQRYEMESGFDSSVYKAPASSEDALYEQLSMFSVNVIDPVHVRSECFIGSGQFGIVEQGVLSNGSEKKEVALKTLKDTSSAINIIKFLQEAAIMIQFQHPNIISLLGIVQTEEITLVVEYANNGDLLSYLHNMRKRKPLNKEGKTCLQFCRDIAQGMLYLSCKGYIHRDLAARNIVLKGTTCKITDFGLSRELTNDIYTSSGGLIPVKWTALEALLRRQYSTASDIWSYGCVLYEIWSLGTKPFLDKKNETVIKFLKLGYRLTPPPGCPIIMYKIMIDTWNPTPDDRPTFHDVVTALEREDSTILYIPPEEATGRAAELGAPLEESKSMYMYLQRVYMK